MTGAPRDLLDQVLSGHTPAYALLHRPAATGRSALEVVVGEVNEPGTLAAFRSPPPPRPVTRCWRWSRTGRSRSADTTSPTTGRRCSP